MNATFIFLAIVAPSLIALCPRVAANLLQPVTCFEEKITASTDGVVVIAGEGAEQMPDTSCTAQGGSYIVDTRSGSVKSVSRAQINGELVITSTGKIYAVIQEDNPSEAYQLVYAIAEVDPVSWLVRQSVALGTGVRLRGFRGPILATPDDGSVLTGAEVNGQSAVVRIDSSRNAVSLIPLPSTIKPAYLSRDLFAKGGDGRYYVTYRDSMNRLSLPPDVRIAWLDFVNNRLVEVGHLQVPALVRILVAGDRAYVFDGSAETVGQYDLSTGQLANKLPSPIHKHMLIVGYPDVQAIGQGFVQLEPYLSDRTNYHIVTWKLSALEQPVHTNLLLFDKGPSWGTPFFGQGSMLYVTNGAGQLAVVESETGQVLKRIQYAQGYDWLQ